MSFGRRKYLWYTYEVDLDGIDRSKLKRKWALSKDKPA